MGFKREAERSFKVSCTQVLLPLCSDECHRDIRVHPKWYCFRSIFKINELCNTVNQIHALPFVKRSIKIRITLYSAMLCASIHLCVPVGIHSESNPGSRGKNTPIHSGGTYQPIGLHIEGKDTQLQFCLG